MFDGRDYKSSFDEACEELTFIKDSEEIRNRLIHVEWVLEEAIRGVFFLQSLLLCLIVFIPLGFLFDFNNDNWVGKVGFLVVFAAFGVLAYWLSKFALWHEISRHLKTRRFGDPRIKRESI